MQTNFITKNKILRIKSLKDNIKSHHNLGAFFSSVDISTLREQAGQCNNVLSLVVDNKGTYVAKFTERHKVHKDIAVTEDITTTDSWKYMGEKEDSSTTDSTEHSNKTDDYIEIRCWDCDIERPLGVSIDEDFKKECIEKIDLFKKTKEEEKSIKLTNNYRNISDRPRYYQSNLFGDEWNNIKTDKTATIRSMVNSLFELSFTPSYYYSALRVDYLSDELSTDFIQLFINAWLAYYEPNVDDLQKVIDEFSLKSENSDYPITRDTILNYLTEIHEEYLDMELEDDRQ